MRTTVVLDVGETLVDETPHWAAWAQWLGVPELTAFGVLGGLVARGRDHRELVAVLRPGRTFDGERAARTAAGAPDPELRLYPDALPCLAELKSGGWQVVVAGNQPTSFQRLVEDLGLPVDLVTSSGSLGAEKPSSEYFARLTDAAGVGPQQCVHVGDRVDNDVVAAGAAGLLPVHVRRGPWGLLHDAPAGVPVLDDLSALPALLAGMR